MRIDCSPALLRALCEANACRGETEPHRALLTSLLRDPEGAASSAARNAGFNDLACQPGQPTIVTPHNESFQVAELCAELRAVVRLAGCLARDSFHEGELTTEFVLLALLRLHSGLAQELCAHGLVLDQLAAMVSPQLGKILTVPGIDLEGHGGNIESFRGDKFLKLARTRVYFLVSARSCVLGLERAVKEAMAGGVGIIQSREKSISDKSWLSILELLRMWTEASGALLVVNDRPDMAMLCGADGVHVGQDDLAVSQARGVAGNGIVVGTSTHSIGQWNIAVADKADYAGVGPVFPSGTKDFAMFPGLDYVRQVASTNQLPWFALGGISAENIVEVAEAGAVRVAVSACLAASENPRAVASALLKALGG